VLGFTFKENCPDIRNTKVIDIITTLKAYECEVDVVDPWASPTEVSNLYDIQLIQTPEPDHYDAIIVAVSHDQFAEQGLKSIRSYGKSGAIVYDVKSMFAGSDKKL
jgi:UDP-N-acetyl-D-glucosamine/UDP-N-acetyl-D-galactosamine dehydrogenase